MDDRRIGLAAGAEGAEDQGAHRDGSQDRAGEDEIFPERAGDERNAVLVRELVVLLDVRRAAERGGPAWATR